MAKKPQPPSSSSLSKIFPLLFLLTFLVFAAIVFYVVYMIVTDIADKTSKKMEEKHITLSKDGLKVGIKELKEENYVGKTQSVLVNVWNYSTWPAYKSRLWNKEAPKTEQKKVR
ncbi:MAG: hypothetical protein MMC33_005917 [Icmadophila ericetorum]|nr:hypothetical protein [Icmadophila ericetorum]